MSELAQYALLFGLTIGTLGFVLTLYSLARVFGRTRAEPGKDVPASAGELSRVTCAPLWCRARTWRARVGSISAQWRYIWPQPRAMPTCC